MSLPILARQTYNKTPAPPSYDQGYVDREHAAIQRAIPRAFTRPTTAATTVSALDDLILADATGGPFTVTLPPADRVKDLRVTIKKTDASANAVTVGGTVDGTANPTLATRYKSMTVQSDGITWHKLASV